MEGTKVTIESFLAWKAKFDEERMALKANKAKENLGLTGKEIFLSNADMNTSDVNFEGVEETVQVDESLFEDLDDLDVGDSDSDSDR